MLSTEIVDNIGLLFHPDNLYYWSVYADGKLYN